MKGVLNERTKQQLSRMEGIASHRVTSTQRRLSLINNKSERFENIYVFLKPKNLA